MHLHRQGAERSPITSANRRFIRKIFDIDISVCMSCQICVEVCPFEAIKMDTGFELSRSDRFGGLLAEQSRTRQVERVLPHRFIRPKRRKWMPAGGGKGKGRSGKRPKRSSRKSQSCRCRRGGPEGSRCDQCRGPLLRGRPLNPHRKKSDVAEGKSSNLQQAASARKRNEMAGEIDQAFVHLKHWLVLLFPVGMQPLASVLLSIIPIVAVFPLLFAITTILERKGLGRIQNRFGPNRVGPSGYFSP